MLNGSSAPAVAMRVLPTGLADAAIPPQRANSALDEPLSTKQRAEMIESATRKLEELLEVLSIDHAHDPNTRETASRVARTWVELIAPFSRTVNRFREFCRCRSRNIHHMRLLCAGRINDCWARLQRYHFSRAGVERR